MNLNSLKDCANIVNMSLDRLKENLKIGVVFGGNKEKEGAVIYKNHNVRPWKSYEIVANDIVNALRDIGFKNVSIFCDDMTFIDSIKENNIDICWLNTGGVQGFSPMSHAASMLEMLGIPYVGHNPFGNSIMDNKHIFKQIIKAVGIKTPDFIVVNPFREDIENLLKSNEYKKVFGDYEGEFIIKPVSGRASIGVAHIERESDLIDAIKILFKERENLIIIEKYINGDEYCIGVGGEVVYRNGILGVLDKPFVFSEVQRILSEDEKIFTSMDKKPITQDRAKLIDNKDKAKQTLKEIAANVFIAFELESLIRIDLRANKEGDIFVIEANPKPDLKKVENGVISLITIGLEEQGMSYNDLILSNLINSISYSLKNRPYAIRHISHLFG